METNSRNARPYKKFFVTLIISFFVMYGVMFLNIDDINHIYLSTTRVYMALLMVSPMALIMIAIMGSMYMNKRHNAIIMSAAVLVFILALGALRNQTFIGDKEYMKGMIPHHSSAVLTSSHAKITDPRVRKLADGIIASQEREIGEMKELLKTLDK